MFKIRHDLNTRPTTSMADRDLMRYLRRIAFKASKKYDLGLKEFDFFPLDHKDAKHAHGVCEQFSRRIYINLYDPITGAFDSLESLIDTTLHEVAHLKFKRDGHTKRFWAFLYELRDWYFKQDLR